MEYIIDGFNVIKTSFIKKYEKYGIEKAEEFLVDILEKYKRKHPSVEITIVFDGKSPSFSFYHRRKIKIVFSNEVSADEKIRKILENKKNKANILIVSDDRQVQEFSKILGSKFLKVVEFLEIVYPEEKKEPQKYEKEIKYSLKSKIEKELKNHYEKKVEKFNR